MMVLKTRTWWRGPGYDTSTALRPLPKYASLHAIQRLRLKEEFSTTAKVYLVAQLIMAFGLFVVLVADQPKWPRWEDSTILTAFIVASLTSQGNLLDGGSGVWYAEIARCVVGVCLFETWGWYVLSWFHLASLVVVIVKRHTVQGPLTDAATTTTTSLTQKKLK
ncbi:transmembrane protein, putative [Bodo saltans]|uniref:Transmembrane protein, putative n=1 Tax=Bodo saltans TaxID=75058 RepID=A0A0S4IWT6_BODSA|nr:transmembrane protein, putative [Bodo saltans]|eukprot:CUG32648.1 transmembrane protein, putative [Bodo saltans]